MINLDDIIERYDNAIDNGDASPEELTELLELGRAMMKTICDFVEDNDFDWTDYAAEYLSRDRSARWAAVEAFAEMLENLEEYI